MILSENGNHLEVRQKYSATRRIFNSLFGVWKCAQTLSFVFNIFNQVCVIYCFKLVLLHIVPRDRYLRYCVMTEFDLLSGGFRPWANKGGGGGVDLLALLAFLPSVISTFLPKIRRRVGPFPIEMRNHPTIRIRLFFHPFLLFFTFVLLKIIDWRRKSITTFTFWRYR